MIPQEMSATVFFAFFPGKRGMVLFSGNSEAGTLFPEKFFSFFFFFLLERKGIKDKLGTYRGKKVKIAVKWSM